MKSLRTPGLAGGVLVLLSVAGVLLTTGCDSGKTANPAVESPAAKTEPAPDPADLLFADVTKELDIDFVHEAGSDREKYFMPRSVGSGAAWFDFDNDGRLDLYLLQNGGAGSKSTCRLYRQSDAGKFVDVSAGSGLDFPAMGMGVAVGDVNNDGQVDVLVTEYGRTRLFVNRSTGAQPRFVDATKSSGIENVFWGVSSGFIDYDRDGWLDLVLVNYIDYDSSRWCADGSGRQDFCGPDNFAGRITRLYRNETGTKPPTAEEPARFREVTNEAGLAAQPGPGLGVFCADFNGDRWPDIFIANDGKPNHLWINQKDGKFKEEGLLSGVATNAMGKAEANMGIAIGDVDGNGLFDIFVTHLTTETHTLWAQEPLGVFQDRTVATGVTRAWRGTGFGTIMADFNNDGAVDLSLVNGRVLRGPKPARIVAGMDPFWDVYSERNQVLVNDGHNGFRDVSPSNDAFSGFAAVSRGLACGDFDNDGGVDLVVTRIAAPVAVYRNVAPKRGHWLLVRAVDPALKRDAYGAEIHLKVGGREQMRWTNPAYSFLCANDPRAHFGLGAVEKYDAVRVIWPDGAEEIFPGGAADRQVVLRKGEGKAGTP